ncbi:MAG: cell division protein ZapE [Candidimonas sp.]|nr:MAG: cell division protein ZapE [Candidimonas sp.]
MPAARFVNVREYYQKALDERGYRPDAAQLAAVERLQRYFDDWVVFRRARSSTLKKIFRRPDVPRGVYLWGGVGRGKSFLMDAFYLTVPVSRKTRIHFHEFMRSVHRELELVHGQPDPLDVVATRVAKRYRLICFDEFHVSDIADAMILYRLLRRLFELGTSFVMTSNYEPSTLYPDGLHRDRILPAIALIEARMDVLNVDGGIDYRHRALAQVRTYLTPIGAGTTDELRANFKRLSDTAPQKPVLEVGHREIQAVALSGSIVWFDFATLCGGARSQDDYLDLAKRFRTIILSDVPRMDARDASAARRFTWLIDVLYDHRVKLIMSAQCAPEALYTRGPMVVEFQRTVSRLSEMQTLEYLESQQRHAVEL